MNFNTLFSINFDTLFSIFNSAGYSLFIVGGMVRDFLIARNKGVEEIKEFWLAVSNGQIDVDMATSATPEQVISLLEANGIKYIPIGIEFGTIQALIADQKIEITTFRGKEQYGATRKPQVVFSQSLKADLTRRDFTFNSLAMDESGTIVDYFGGREDLKEGIIRTPGNPIESFSDDPLRILRACRFVGRGLGEIATETQEAMKATAPQLNKISGERIVAEVTKILMSDFPEKGLRALEKSGALGVVFPELQALVEHRLYQGDFHSLWVWEHTLKAISSSAKDPIIRWALLFHDVAKPLCREKTHTGVHFYGHSKMGSQMWDKTADRIKTGNHMKNAVSGLIKEHQSLGDIGDKGLRRLHAKMGQNIYRLFELRRADILAHHPDIIPYAIKDLDEKSKRFEEIKSPIELKLPTGLGGLVMKELGLKPGPKLGKIMAELKQRLIDGDLEPTTDWVKEINKIPK